MEQWRKDARKEAIIVDLDALVPKDHLLRKIEKVMDYEWLYERLEPYYNTKNPVTGGKCMANYGKYMIGIRLLLEKQYLETNAGRNRYVKRSELEAFLKEKGYPVEKKTLYADFAVLETVFGLQLEYDPHKKGYRLLNPPFEPYELRLLIDCVQASPFITENEMVTVTSKIRRLAMTSDQRALERHVEVQDRIVRAEESVLRKVDVIHTALIEKRKIRFRYFFYVPERNNNKQYYQTKSGDGYMSISPRKLLVSNGEYWLDYYREESGDITDVRPHMFEVAKMEDIQLCVENRVVKDTSRFDSTYNMAMDMIDGKERVVTMRFRNNYIDAVRECFGNDIPMIPVDDYHFNINYPMRLSNHYMVQLLEHGCYGKVVAPPEAVSTMIDAISELALLYESDKEPYSVLTQKELDDIFLPDYEQDLDYVFDDESMIKNDGEM